MCNKHSNNTIVLEKQTYRIQNMLFNKAAAMAAVPTQSMLTKMMNKQEILFKVIINML